MNLKKYFSILLIATCLIAVSQSAFAEEVNRNVVKPNVINLGDTRDTAIDLFDGAEYNLYLENANDEDWFRWTNNTGSPKMIHSLVYNNGGQNVIVQGAIIKYNATTESSLVFANPTVKGEPNLASTFLNYYVPEGATVSFRVKAEEFTAIENYRLRFYVAN